VDEPTKESSSLPILAATGLGMAGLWWWVFGRKG
jgi:hypothetical protein